MVKVAFAKNIQGIIMRISKKISATLSSGNCLMMAHMMIDEGQMKAAQMWLTVAEEKLELFKDETTREVVDITKEIIANVGSYE